MENNTPTQLVEKENIPQLSFSKTSQRKLNPSILKELDLAMRGGNTDKIKYRIEFSTNTGVKQVETTVWAAGEKYVCLKGGVWIPIANILSIRSL
ncbi:MAG: hypothetical protein MK078_11165 [Crocinitomicaceae bacterium]|nr:hypothetical protein [Crocinitomicaceae bacterium]